MHGDLVEHPGRFWGLGDDCFEYGSTALDGRDGVNCTLTVGFGQIDFTITLFILQLELSNPTKTLSFGGIWKKLDSDT